MPSAAKPAEVKTSSKVPEIVKTPEIPETSEMNMDTPEETMSEEKHNFVPLYMSAIVFALIILSYVYCFATGLEVNLYRELGAIGISGLITAACWYISK